MELYSKACNLKKGLKRARKRAGYTQVELAKMLNVSIKTIMNWEQGIATPAVDTLIGLCDLYECDLDYLMGKIDCRTHDVQEIHEYTGLSEQAIETLHEWGNSFDQKKYWPSVLSMMIEDPRFSDVMENICSAQYIFRKLPLSDSRENVKMKDEEATILAFLWYISKGFSGIAEDIISIKYDVN